MIFLRALILAAALVTLSAGAATQNITYDLSALLGRAGTGQLSCADDGVTSVCGDCQTVVACEDGANGAELEACSGGTPYCLEGVDDKMEGSCQAATTGNTFATPCECTTDDNQCDPYDPTQWRICMDGVADIFPCPNGGTCYYHDGETAICGKEPPPECEKDGWSITSYPECTSYALCDKSEVVEGSQADCKEGRVFDPTQINCVTPPLLPCQDGCVDGFCASPYNSSVRNICDRGDLVASRACSGNDPFVNYEDGSCTNDENLVHPLTKCDLGPESSIEPPMDTRTPSITPTATPPTTRSITTTTSKPTTTPTTTTTATITKAPTTPLPLTTPPSSACNEATVYDMWADPESKDCKGYYQCQITPSYTYKMVHGTCPNLLLFNADPAVRKCDLEENVTCQN